MSTITLRRGDDYDETLAVKQDDGATAYNLAGCTLWFTLKLDPTVADDDADIQHKTGVGTALVVTDAALGLATHRISGAETSALALGLGYAFDYQLKSSDGTIKTLDSGTLWATNDVTLSTT